MTPQELSLRYALLKVLVAELAAAKSVADCEIRDTWRPKDRLSAALPDGTVVAAVTLTSGRVTAAVADVDRYEAWVRVNHPEAIETVPATERINPDFTARLTSAARKIGVAVDAETGEVVPGIEVTTGDPYPMVKLTEDARDEVAKAWRDGSLTELVAGLLAIEGGES
jgi:hypothetical protein